MTEPLNPALDAALSRASTGSEPTRRGLCRLDPRAKPGPAARPDTRRAISGVDPALFATLSGLVRGELPWPLYLWGPPGTGKTSAALTLLDQCGAAPLPGSWPPVVRDWMAGFVEVRHLPSLRIGADQGRYQWSRDGNAGDVTWESLRRRLAAVPLFVFDEIGVGREATDFRLDLLLDVLGVRCDDPVRPFVVTSNRTPEEIAHAVYDERVASRVLCGTVFKLSGDDRRISN